MEVAEEIEYEGLPSNAGLSVSPRSNLSGMVWNRADDRSLWWVFVWQVSMMAGALVSFWFLLVVLYGLRGANLEL